MVTTKLYATQKLYGFYFCNNSQTAFGKNKLCNTDSGINWQHSGTRLSRSCNVHQ